MTKQVDIEVEGRTLKVSNLEKVLYPGGRFTKADVISYYIRVARYLLPHLKNRPVTLKRFPDGVFGDFFYEKDAPAFTPEWIETFPVPRRERPGEDIRYILINDLPTLVWLANIGNLEIHPFLHKVPKIQQPTAMVFDCDPGEGANVLLCAKVAFRLREILTELGLKSWPKLSGSKGLQVYVPLNTSVGYDLTQPFAKSVAELLAQQEPKLIVAEMSKVLRRRRVFIDWSQNADFKTTVGVYSLRAKSYKPLVAMPVEWRELAQAMKADDADALRFDPDAAITRIEQRGDLFKPLLSLKQSLPEGLRPLGQRPQAPRSPRQTRREAVRRSAQGGRRRFFVLRSPGSFKLGLELEGALKVWRVKATLPMRNKEYTGELLKDTAASDFDRTLSAPPKPPWEVGAYETIEGSFRRGDLRIYLAGTRVKGEWILERLSERRWRLKKSGGAATAATKASK